MTISAGIDFGTTNSVVVLAFADGTTRTLRFTFESAPDSETCRTLLCLWQEQEGGRRIVMEAIGADAINAYLDDPAESRLILSMKSYLAQASFRETQWMGRRYALEDLIARFLTGLADKLDIDPATLHATVGRPVRFAGERADDALGEQRLRDSFARAGFRDIDVGLEPEGAGWRFANTLDQPATILVGDFGGGTSDFSVLRFDPDASRRTTALGYAGVGIAGDQLDYRIVTNVVAPELGSRETYSVMGGTPLPTPVEWYADLARWHRLSLMRTPQTLRAIADVARTATRPDRLHNLITLIEDQQAQALYRAVSNAKIELSRSNSAVLSFRHGKLHIEATITRADFESWIVPDIDRFEQAALDAVARAGLEPYDIDRVFLTGGTSFVPAVRARFAGLFGAERIDTGGEFVSVAEGLALMGRQRTH